MKVKIKRLADGGGFATFTPIIHSPPVQQANNATSTAAAPASSSILDENTIKELYKAGGLVNDVNKLVSELIQLEKTSDLPYLNSGNRSQSLQMIAKINELSQSKKGWEDAITRAKEAGGLGEVAVDTYGRVFTKTQDNKISSMTVDQYSAKKDKTKLLSVQELLYERQYNPTLVGQNQIFTVSDNAIGMNKITSHIKDLVSALGTETDETSKFYGKEQISKYLADVGAKKPTAQEQESLKLLQEILATPGSYAQVDTKNSSQRNQIGKALNYIWDTLGEPAQQKLKATAAMNGVDNPKQFILGMLESQTDYSTTTTITPKELPGQTAVETAETAAKASKVALTPQELFHTDRLATPGMRYEINNPKAGVSLNVAATAVGPLWDLRKEGEVIPPSTINSVLINNNYRAIVDPAKVFIGDQRIDPMLLREVAYTGEDVAKVYMPVRSDGSPDLGKTESFNRAYQEYNRNKDTWTVQQIEQYFRKEGFPGIKISETNGPDGKVTRIIADGGPVKPFLAMPIITNSASDIADNPWMIKMMGAEEDAAELLMKDAFTVYGGTAAKPTSKNTSPSATFALEIPYKGVMFVSYRPEANAYLYSTQKHFSGRAANELDTYRNLNYSSNSSTPGGIQASAEVL